MSFLIFIHSYYLIKTLLKCFYIALVHISIRTRKKSDLQLLLWLKLPFMAGLSIYGIS